MAELDISEEVVCGSKQFEGISRYVVGYVDTLEFCFGFNLKGGGCHE